MPRLTMTVLIDKTLTKLVHDPQAHERLLNYFTLASAPADEVRNAVALVLGAGLDVMDFMVDAATGEIVDRTGQVRPRDDRNFRHLGGGRGGAKRVR